MPAYLTPARYKKMAFGIDTSELDDIELAALCSQATTMVNAYCLAPRLPQAHDFRGGTVTNEQHQWRYPETPFDIGQRKAYPFHWPIKKMNEFRIYVTNTQYVGIDATELFVNNSLRYVEVVSLALTSAGLFNALVVPNIGLATPVVRLSYDYGWAFYEPGEQLNTDDGQVYRAQNQWWYADQQGTDAMGFPIGGPATVYIDGIDDPSTYSIDYDEGIVILGDGVTASSVTATYYYKLPPEIQWATGHIVTYLHAEGEMFARGMGHLDRMQIGEVSMARTRKQDAYNYDQGGGGSLVTDLAQLVPEAANLLASYRFDGVSVR